MKPGETCALDLFVNRFVPLMLMKGTNKEAETQPRKVQVQGCEECDAIQLAAAPCLMRCSNMVQVSVLAADPTATLPFSAQAMVEQFDEFKRGADR